MIFKLISKSYTCFQEKTEECDEEMDLSDINMKTRVSSHHLVRILRELFHRLPQNTSFQRNMLAVFDADFVDDDDDENETHLHGLDTKTLCELLEVNKSTVSRARNDSENLLLSVKYPPDVT